MYADSRIWMAHDGERIYLHPEMANRHGLIAGATGTGKTITMKVMAESFSAMGVPVFLSDIKGDLSGMITPGEDNEGMQKRIKRFGIDNWSYTAFPSRFWDIFGEKGHPVRVTVSEMGPMLLARLLDLSDVQQGVLNIAFHVADENGWLLLDLKDLRAMLQYLGEHKDEICLKYGNVTPQSIGAIQRALLQLEGEGGEIFFGQPELELTDLMRTDVDGRGYINILSSEKLSQSPTVYATFLLWMLAELFEKLPEVGDLPKPRLVFFFDEVHMLFTDMPKALLQKITQVVKLIRSKGVGVYFITQNPQDIPDEVLAQLANRVQHALRAYTPAEQKAVRVAAQSFRANPAFDTETAIGEMGTGEALVSFLDEEGIPQMVHRAFILPPQSLMGPSDLGKVNQTIAISEFDLKYRNAVDNRSAYEELTEVAEEEAAAEAAAAEAEAKAKEEAEAVKQAEKEAAAAEKQRLKEEAAAEKKREKEREKAEAAARKREEQAAARRRKTTDRLINNMVGQVGSAAGKAIVRGLFGTRK